MKSNFSRWFTGNLFRNYDGKGNLFNWTLNPDSTVRGLGIYLHNAVAPAKPINVVFHACHRANQIDGLIGFQLAFNKPILQSGLMDNFFGSIQKLREPNSWLGFLWKLYICQ